MAPSIPRWLSAALTSLALVAAVTAVIALLEPGVPALGLAVLYLVAVVPIALAYGLVAAGAVSVVSMATFSFLFLDPRHSLDPGTWERVEVLSAFLVSSLVVSHLAVRSRRDAQRSARLADEQAALRRVATLVGRAVPPSEVFAAAAREAGLLLGVDATHLARYELDGTVTRGRCLESQGRANTGRHTCRPRRRHGRRVGVADRAASADRRLRECARAWRRTGPGAGPALVDGCPRSSSTSASGV